MPVSNATVVEILFVTVWVLCCFAILNFKQIRRLRRLASRFSGSLAVYSLFLPSVEGLWQGLRFYVHAGPRSHVVTGTLAIRLFVPAILEFRIIARSLLVRVASKARVLPEVRMGDDVFDAEYAVFARQGASVSSYLGQAAVRQGLHAIFGRGFWMVIADRRGIRAEKLAYDRELDLESTAVAEVLRSLKLMATGI